MPGEVGGRREAVRSVHGNASRVWELLRLEYRFRELQDGVGLARQSIQFERDRIATDIDHHQAQGLALADPRDVLTALVEGEVVRAVTAPPGAASHIDRDPGVTTDVDGRRVRHLQVGPARNPIEHVLRRRADDDLVIFEAWPRQADLDTPRVEFAEFRVGEWRHRQAVRVVAADPPGFGQGELDRRLMNGRAIVAGRREASFERRDPVSRGRGRGP